MTRVLPLLCFGLLLSCGSADAPPPELTAPEGGAKGPAVGQPPAGGPQGEGGATELEVPTEPSFTQEALAAEGGVKLTGTLSCPEGRGPFVVQVFPPPPEQGGAEKSDGPAGPVVKLALTEAGPFTLMAPKGASGVIVGFEDGDGNGAPTPGEPLFFEGGGGPQVVEFKADRTGLDVNCEATMGGPGQGGPGSKVPPTPKGGDGPPAEGGPAKK